MDILLSHGYFIAEDEHEQKIMKPYPTPGLLYISSHLNPKIKSKSIDRKRYREALAPEVAEYIEINDESLRRNDSFRRYVDRQTLRGFGFQIILWSIKVN